MSTFSEVSACILQALRGWSCNQRQGGASPAGVCSAGAHFSPGQAPGFLAARLVPRPRQGDSPRGNDQAQGEGISWGIKCKLFIFCVFSRQNPIMAAEDETKPAKRGRGRPAKAESEKKAPKRKAEPAVDDEGNPVAKKGRGRPPGAGKGKKAPKAKAVKGVSCNG